MVSRGSVKPSAMASSDDCQVDLVVVDWVI